jgi:D-xylonolactonase
LSEPRYVWNAHARLGESALWSSSGQSLYWVDILGKQLHRFTPGNNQQSESRASWHFNDEISAIAERLAATALLPPLGTDLRLSNPRI